MAITRSTHATTTVLVRTSRTFLVLLDLCVEALRRRRIRRYYRNMTDAQLSDIGLTPHDVQAALSLPLEQSASDAVVKAAAAEAARW